MVTCFTRSPWLKKDYEDHVAVNPLTFFFFSKTLFTDGHFPDIKSCNFTREAQVSAKCFFPSEMFRSIHQQYNCPHSLTKMDPRALHCLELRLPRQEGWQERQDCQAMAMQNPTYFFHKPFILCNSNESREDSYSPYPTSPHTHICSSNILNEKLMCLLTLRLAALCPVQVVKASLEHGKGNLQL